MGEPRWLGLQRWRLSGKPKHPLLSSTRRRVDQQANRAARSDHRVTIDPGRLSGNQGVSSSLKVTVPSIRWAPFSIVTLFSIDTESPATQIKPANGSILMRITNFTNSAMVCCKSTNTFLDQSDLIASCAFWN